MKLNQPALDLSVLSVIVLPSAARDRTVPKPSQRPGGPAVCPAFATLPPRARILARGWAFEIKWGWSQNTSAH